MSYVPDVDNVDLTLKTGWRYLVKEYNCNLPAFDYQQEAFYKGAEAAVVCILYMLEKGHNLEGIINQLINEFENPSWDMDLTDMPTQGNA